MMSHQESACTVVSGRLLAFQKLFYVDVDLNNPSVVVRPYISAVAEGKETAAAFLSRVGAIAGINRRILQRFDITIGSGLSR